MEQLRQVGEALGGITALMSFHHELRVNPRQCRLLADACALALDAVAAEVRACLRFDDRLVAGRWKPLESPLRELCRAVRDAEHYIRLCFGDLHGGSWWARAAALTHGVECVELHLHGLLWCVAVALEAVEVVAEATAALNPDELARRRVLLARDYDKDLLDPFLFRRSRVGKAYLATQELAGRMDTAWAEDRWLLSQLLDEMRSNSKTSLSRQDHRLADLLAAPRGERQPAAALLLEDFHMRRRLGGSLKEVQWMGEAFSVKHYVGVDADDPAIGAEVALLTSVAHPNVAHCRYCFHDEEKRELFLVMDQIMSKDLGTYVKEAGGTAKRPRAALPLVVVVDAMLQIARGMEHLHSKKIYHGELSPSNVLIKTRGAAADAYLIVKVAGFGGESAAAVSSPGRKASHAASAAAGANSNANGSANPCIWYAPEVLENEGPGQEAARRTEKADVYSFGMICFELLTGKIPFEDNHLQGDNTSKNIRAGERPLFPFQAPKYLTGLTRRCWHADPAQRPPFSSICRVLRYVKRFLVMNPEQHGGQADASTPATPPAPTPAVDYLDIEALLLKKLPAWQQQGGAAPRVSDVPFEMYAYRVMEKERGKAAILHVGRSSDSGSEATSLCGDDSVHSGATLPDVVDAAAVPPPSPRAKTWSRSLSTRSTGSSRLAPWISSPRKPAGRVAATKAGPPEKSRSMGVVRQTPPQAIRRTPRIMSDGQLQAAVIPPSRRREHGGHASDSELAA